MRGALIVTAAALLGVACHRQPSRPARTEAPLPSDPAARDAEELGRQVLALLDRAADFRGAHQGTGPRSLREAGLDSLTPQYARVLTATDSGVSVTVTFRHPEGRVYLSCTGGLADLEASGLGTGSYALQCTRADGTVQSVTAGGPVR